MKKQQWILGLVISAGIALIAFSPRFMRMEKLNAGFVAVSILYNFFFCFSCWIIYQYLFRKTRLVTLNKYRIVIACITILSVAHLTFIYDYLFSFFTDWTIQFPEIEGKRRFFILLLRGLLISGLFYFFNYYLHVLAEKQKSHIEVEQLKQAQLAANLSSLKEQLSPHFLFNTLNTLSSLTQEKEVKDFVAKLSDVYRYVLQYKELDTATLQQELLFIESYLYIIKTRLENSIDITINVNGKILESKIPPLTLQLLIENAVKHNIASGSRQLKIEITDSKDNFLVVTNNFQPKRSLQLSTGTGLSNLMQRYRLLFNREISIESNEHSFVVKLPVIC